ncbi:hypothetical protein SH1V18_15450 [Vallitalea longa]|uniref:HTH cro/C1-type domain-containing protein n=1 Tax=Vallitalea longa TaxID=2936439 RepID=A0A9W5Y8D7_9FIRM|nr:helix-turn-helix transcriptional regulator [Vallitalea longa]GKX29065.1 hypothetical protein SH1V18_15450 [Vallitalea longa]
MIRLKELRKSNKISLEALSEILHVNKSTLSRIENGSREPKLSFIEDCAKYFNCTTDYLLNLTDVSCNDKKVNKNNCLENIFKEMENILSCKNNVKFNGNIMDNESKELVLLAIKHAKDIAEYTSK